MSATYTYSISVDFPNSAVYSTALVQEIEGSAIAVELLRIDTEGDDCNIVFQDSLSVGDEVVLDSIVSSHTGIEANDEGVVEAEQHILNLSNPHSTGFFNMASGTLSSLNSIITDATIDDVSGARTPVDHAITHQSGGADELTVQLLGSGAAVTGKMIETDGQGGWSLVDTVTVSGGFSRPDHRQLDQLVHNIAEDSFEEITYSGNKVQSIVAYTDMTKLIKIREEEYSYTDNKIYQVITRNFDSVGTVISGEVMVETYNYSGPYVISIDREVS